MLRHYTVSFNIDLDDLSSAESANYSVSDISGETYNSISDFDDDDDYDFTSHVDALDDDDDDVSSNSQVIDISNDSSESRFHFGKFMTNSTMHDCM